MPLINGACIPPICMTRRLIRPGATLLQIIVRAGQPPQVINVTNNPLYAPLLPQGLNKLAAMADIDCDGCVCAGRVKFKPPIRTPASLVVDQSQDTDAAGVTTDYVYVVTAQWDILTLGFCFPPGSTIQIGGQGPFIPVEDAPKEPVEYPTKASGTPGSKKGKKKKRKGAKGRMGKARPTQRTRRRR